MPSSDPGKFQKDLNAGLTGLVVLALLARSSEDLYGYEIAKRLQFAKEGTLYPVLRSLAAGGLLSSRIVPSYSGPPRRYYRITGEGRAMLASWLAIWTRTRDAVDHWVAGPTA